MKRLVIFSGFVLGNFAILVISLVVLTIYTSKQSSAQNSVVPQDIKTTQQSYAAFNSPAPTDPGATAYLVSGDARPKLIDAFFARYNSPMTGLGQDIVTAADKYQIPYGYLPAIAQCEGNVGKSMPANSFNPYGYGIYGGQITRFSSWQEGINAVSQTLRTDYFDLGLDTPEKIMPKYTPPSQGSWAFCVDKFLNELK
ncbi:MAG: hypothetical protein M1484_03105 [Patescibacteria group bacterium]|nr:hypothetical protein [Patescibacteria group bacterium]MCL5432052.1 hypothetical protein [Patescibacteria group bacterium]